MKYKFNLIIVLHARSRHVFMKNGRIVNVAAIAICLVKTLFFKIQCMAPVDTCYNKRNYLRSFISIILMTIANFTEVYVSQNHVKLIRYVIYFRNNELLTGTTSSRINLFRQRQPQASTIIFSQVWS